MLRVEICLIIFLLCSFHSESKTCYFYSISRFTKDGDVNYRPCAGEKLFECHNCLGWKAHAYFPNDCEQYFNSYELTRDLYDVTNGLVIKPSLRDDVKTSYTIQNCTWSVKEEVSCGVTKDPGRPTNTNSHCTKERFSYNILPPVRSMRLYNTRTSFKYGRIDVWAQLSLGDWLVPEIFLEPRKNKFGYGFKSGRIRIASAFGNRKLITNASEEIGAKVLRSGILWKRNNDLKTRIIHTWGDEHWGKRVHQYSVIWKPSGFTFLVDDDLVEEIDISSLQGGIREVLGFTPLDEDEDLDPMHPFSEEFQLGVQLAVGGVANFPEGCVTGNGHPKPWVSKEIKATLRFHQDQQNWYSTWSGTEFYLKIDRILITAL